ncbi:MAG: DUF481 domain-containing protein [Microscillaceae bacterium]|nr:DUF481 domain-containing protein [Microscillaceae bacterium]
MQRYCLSWLLCLLGFFQSVEAQIDSTQKAPIDSLIQLNRQLQKRVDSLLRAHTRPPVSVRPAFLYRISTDATFSSGNVNRELVVLASSWSYTKGLFSLEMNPRYAYGEQNGNVAERDFFTDFNFDVFHPKSVYGFGLGILETSNLRAIDLRLLGGLGIGFHILRRPNAAFSITNALIYESTDFRTNRDILTFRNSTRLKGKYTLFHNRLKINHLVFIQPSVQESDNIRWSANLGIELPLHKLLSLRTAINNSYESVVAEGRRRNDFTWTVGLTFGNK